MTRASRQDLSGLARFVLCQLWAIIEIDVLQFLELFLSEGYPVKTATECRNVDFRKQRAISLMCQFSYKTWRRMETVNVWKPDLCFYSYDAGIEETQRQGCGARLRADLQGRGASQRRHRRDGPCL
jgi:hypothetical protein